MSNDTDQHLPIGFSVAHYEIRAVLGIGGFGITYKAWDAKLERWVALKEFLPAELALRDRDNITVRAHSNKTEDYEYALERFLLEARTLAKFSHTNIVRVLDYLQANGTAYLIMEYVEGKALSAYLRKNSSRVSEEQLKTWFEPLLRGLGRVHAAGFLHRDIKPGNIYIREDGDPILIDFGAARQAIGEHSRSVSGVFTPGYAPVEQYATNSKNQGPWTDLYAMGATLYRCISRVVPMDAPSRQSAIMEGDPDPLVPAVDIGRAQYTKPFLQLIDELLVLPIKDRAKSAVTVLTAMEQGLAPSQVPEQPEPGEQDTEVAVYAEGGAAPEQIQKPLSSNTPRTGSSEPAIASSPPPIETRSPNRKPLGILVALLVLALTGGGYWAYTQNLAATAKVAAADARSQAKAEARALAEQESKAQAEAKALAEQETKAQAEAEARTQAEAEARTQAEAEARAQAEAEARTQAEAEARTQAEAEAEARTQAEAEAGARTQAEAEARAQAEAEAKAQTKAKALADCAICLISCQFHGGNNSEQHNCINACRQAQPNQGDECATCISECKATQESCSLSQPIVPCPNPAPGKVCRNPDNCADLGNRCAYACGN